MCSPSPIQCDFSLYRWINLAAARCQHGGSGGLLASRACVQESREGRDVTRGTAVGRLARGLGLRRGAGAGGARGEVGAADADACFVKAEELFDRGSYDGAANSYKKAALLRPDYAPAHNGVCVSLYKLGQLEGAARACRRALDLQPRSPLARRNMGRVLQGLGRLEEAARAFLEAVRLKPDDAMSHNNLGVTYYWLGRYAEAVASLERALRLRPDLAEGHGNLGCAYLDPDQASALLRLIYKDRVVDARR
jgi:Flp pilus assembly protein TadD